MEKRENSEIEDVPFEEIPNEVKNAKEKEPSVLKKGESENSIPIEDAEPIDVETKDEHDFMNDDSYLKDMVETPTGKEVPEDDEEATGSSSGSSPSVDELREQIRKEEQEAAAKYTVDDLREIAEFVIEGLDAVISTGLKMYANDNSFQPYALQKSKKDKLTDLLTKIFVKYQLKFPLEAMFIVLLIAMYVGPFRAARKNRKENKKTRQPNKKNKPEPSTFTEPVDMTDLGNKKSNGKKKSKGRKAAA